ncbi:MAG: hypothetical protein KME31_01275 [Tolypothrix carrinoi HA7290-LM1]|nr:hypothetical protein [Tolypothrix carrinoi HA7290-LM1]
MGNFLSPLSPYSSLSPTLPLPPSPSPLSPNPGGYLKLEGVRILFSNCVSCLWSNANA